MADSHPFGLHRVLEPQGVMPQAAWKLDNRMECGVNELLIDVERLNIDSASFRQIYEEVGKNEQAIAAKMKEIVAERGKHHNPVTGSGGMLIGRVREIGSMHPARQELSVGDRIATLVSLTLTPLALEEILQIDVANAQVTIRGQAILFATGLYAKMPDDIEEQLALALFDVCGAPAQTARLVQPGQTVVVLGAGGKSGLTVLAAARRSVRDGIVVAMDYGQLACERIQSLGKADIVLDVSAQDAVACLASLEQAWNQRFGQAFSGADVVINCVNVPGTEMASILPCKDGGTVYFFSMATSFTAAALGAEGIGKDIQMMIGNGYCKNHADYALNLLRAEPVLQQIFRQKFAVHSH
ncbi:L-erythro-3,5-diaminohexanoate dehydrogenase [Alicyclobacillus tolerans]|uniref:L-erythro-3,5-diaminohexanoate dehydrogenase n=2 Tax=Alicyclobacillus tolerans TaxID=90970 RepID=A0ABT9LU96_9BACL|nr:MULTISPECIES: L-erythro-3,5-diaminohexanoate dehydrogenase [Alicyclobacillus]MDP9727844.1 L-erythro-3,5-diaminohexanoate dehydrogenase [Alicyclobacillus tengchongensis]SHK49663.1 L-erythro-3,5-diaminohexanoate dehydrogenase [Alicyclobacillus montanus]